MENGPHEEAEVLKENEDDDDELPSATSPSEEVEEDDEDEEPLPKRQKRKSGESASASSPLKEAECGGQGGDERVVLGCQAHEQPGGAFGRASPQLCTAD